MAAAVLPRRGRGDELPRRDAAARAVLEDVSRRAGPTVLARERVLPVPGALAELLPSGLRRGSVVVVDGETGAGATSVALALAAAVTGAGEWAAVLDLAGTVGGRAAAEAGIVLERFAVVRKPPPARFAAVVGALLDGMALVVAEVPRHARVEDARRLVARARERGVVLVPLTTPRAVWPVEATIRLHVEGGSWRGLDEGGLLDARALRVFVEGKGAAAKARHTTVAPLAAVG